MFEGKYWIIISAIVGCVVLWAKDGPQKLRTYALSNLIDHLPLPENWRYFVQFFVFVAVGTFASLIVIGPNTPRQAFAAGLGCTAAFTKASMS